MTSSPAAQAKLTLLVVAFSTFAISVNQPSFVDAQDASATQQRWAIVSIHEEGRALADLLTAELSTWDNVQLLERERIRDVLDELELSASQLQNSDSAMQLGKLSQADALALIDVPTKDNRAKSIRLRLVDVRTSIRLLDVLLPRSGLEEEVTAIRNELRRASATLRVPPEKLRLFGIMPIKSEEPGELLKPFCRALTKLVEVSLQRQPEFVVLERSELQRLTAENELTGVELKLRGATRLLEIGVRRAEDGKRMLVTCRVVSPASRQGQVFRLSTASHEISEVRQAIVTAAMRSVGENVREPQRVTPEVEAKVFDRRGDWFNKAYRFEDAAEMAETAFALAPTPKRLQKLLQEYSRVRQSWCCSS
jgi:Curli production assembly/transport component CsgG